MVNEPVNPYAPYAASAAPLADEAQAKAPTDVTRRRPSRLGAIVVSLLGMPLSGAGLYLMGKRRRFVVWVTAALVVHATTIIAVRLEQPRLFIVATAGLLVVMPPALIDTAFARGGEPPTASRAWLVALSLILMIRAGTLTARHRLAEGFQIPSGAMMPTLLVGDHVMAKKGPRADRGDIIVFKFPADETTDYIKRVIAVSGDVVEVPAGVPSINGVPLAHADIPGACPARDEPADSPGNPGACRLVRETNAGRSYTIMLDGDHPAPDFGPFTVPPGQLFVFGDNRDNSYDSRRWGGVPVANVKGRAAFIWWSKAAKNDVRLSRVGRRVD